MRDPSVPMYAWNDPYFQCRDCGDELVMDESSSVIWKNTWGPEYLPGGAPQICQNCVRIISYEVAEIRLFYRLRTRLVEELREQSSP